MAFWGVELEHGKPYTHRYNRSLGRLRISQATLGDCRTTSGYVVVKCKVGNRIPVSLCSLLADSESESCMLDIELEEKEEDVVFEVIGCRSVHLTGFYLGHNGQSGKVGNYGTPSASQVAQAEKRTMDVVEHDDDGSPKTWKDQEIYDMDAKVNGLRVRTMDSGLVIEDLELGHDRTNKTVAYPGCWVHIYFIVRLKSNGYVTESLFGLPRPNKYLLGSDGLIKGLNIGICGMHIGDKRRITIPPSMGYGSRPDVPQDSWLEVEVQLENISHSS